MANADPQVVLVLGLLLTVSLFAGKIAIFLRLPRVTAYLLVGLIFGPSLVGLASSRHVTLLEPLVELAVALVLFHLGCQFPLHRARRILKHVLRLSFGEMSATFVIVALGIWLLGPRWEIALLLGILAVATAPATTILVLKETESDGTLTEYTQALVAVNNIAAIVGFEIAFLAIELHRNVESAAVAVRFLELFRDLVGSFGLGGGPPDCS